MANLTGTVTTCSVQTSYANKLQSDRFQNPEVKLCPVWNGLDTYGRSVCYDSFYTKTAGCQSAEDRIAVENFQRPRYADFTTLDVSGYLNPSALGQPVSNKESWQAQTQLYRVQDQNNVNMKNGSVGTQYAKVIASTNTGQGQVNGAGSCTNSQCYGTKENTLNSPPHVYEGYTDTRSNQNFQQRRDLSAMSGFKSNCYACAGGRN